MRKMGILNKLNYQAGLLNDGASTEEVVITPDEQAELITESAENITNPEVAETEVLLNEIVAEDEVISEELAEVQEEQEVVAEGLQSDFTAVTTRSMIKSIERINARYGEGSILTAGMQSDRFGGHKDLYVAGLQAKENFFKNAAKNVMLVIESIIEKIKELAQKVVIWLNRDKKAADALLEVIKKKSAALKEGNDGKVKAEDIAAAGDKFGAWLAIGGTIENYATILKSALTNRVALFVNPKEGTNKKPSDYVENTRDALDKMIRSSKVITELGGDKEGTYGVAVVGKTVKALVISVSEKSDDLKVSLETITVPEEEYKTKLESELASIPSLETIKTFATTASELAGSLKSKAELSFKILDDFKKELKSSKEEDVNFAYKKKAATISGQIVLADLNAYTATQKTMIWFASKFVNNYQGTDAKPAEEKK